MDKKVFVHVQGGRKVSGTLRGFDIFLNLVLDDATEETVPAQKSPLGTTVSRLVSSLRVAAVLTHDGSRLQVIRGNSVTSMEILEALR